MAKPEIQLFTIGYQGKTITDFLAILKALDIRIVADIRANPYSRNRDFSQKNLAASLNSEGIQYLHFKTLGSPAELRREVAQTGDYNSFFDQYERYLQSQTATLNLLGNLVIDNVICLLCMEADPQICHRSVVAAKIASLPADNFRINISHL
jgi:uncharacterized protein (DUF488 family)